MERGHKTEEKARKKQCKQPRGESREMIGQTSRRAAKGRVEMNASLETSDESGKVWGGRPQGFTPLVGCLGLCP